MATFKDKISNLIEGQLPDFVLEDHPKFLEFVKQYYSFMESAELSVTSVQTTDGILLETETNQNNELILDGSRIDADKTQLDAGDKILLETSTYGKFTRGETITGQTSNATATILGEDLDNGRLFISAQDKFEMNETVVGNSSNASATINNYRPNPVQNIQELLNFRDPDKVISNFLTKFRNEFLNTMPEKLTDGIDKRNIIKNIKSIYRVKGTQEGHKAFFRMLFGLESQTSYPRENVLRVSNGQWNTNKILRSIATTGDTNSLVGRTITGQTSSATAIVENLFKFQIGADEVSEFILNDDSITGTFQVGEEIRGTSSDTSDTFIKSDITGIFDIPTITNDGALYSSGDTVTISGGGTGAIVQVDSVGRGGLTEFFIDDAGTGYEIGDSLVFNNTGTGGGSAEAKVAVVNGGVRVEGTDEDHIILEDETVKGDPYTGNKVVQESATGSGDITDIRIINAGSNYSSLPTVTITSSSGSSAVVKAYGNQIGRVQSIKIIESGKQHELSPSPPSLSLSQNILFVDRTGTFTIGETVTGIDASSTALSATVSAINTDTNVINLDSATGDFAIDSTITGSSSGATLVVKAYENATATTSLTAVLDTSGSYITQRGHASETTMKLQDSLLYQDFSYIIKVGRTINDWRDDFKKTMHTSGFYFTGEVNVETRVSAELASITGINSGKSGFHSIINLLYSTAFARRLGTVDDGTTLRSTPLEGVTPEFDAAVVNKLFGANTRDVTLTREYTLRFPSMNRLTFNGNTTKFGNAYAGSRFRNVNNYWFMYGGGDIKQAGNVGGDSTYASYITGMTLADWNEVRLIGTKTSEDGDVINFGHINTPDLKTTLALPTEVTISAL
jgi:hypothetical protein